MTDLLASSPRVRSIGRKGGSLATAHPADVLGPVLRERQEQSSDAARRTKSARALGYSLVGVALLLLMLGYLFACAMWVRETRPEGQSAWTLAAFAAVFVTATSLEAKVLYVDGAAGNDATSYAANGPTAPWRPQPGLYRVVHHRR